MSTLRNAHLALADLKDEADRLGGRFPIRVEAIISTLEQIEEDMLKAFADIAV